MNKVADNDALNEFILKGILKAMATTSKNVLPDYRESISKTNENGLTSNVWAKRSDVLEEQFVDNPNIKVLHIKRTKLWQFDPVFNKKTGTLYLLFSDKNLKSIRNKYLKSGKSKHYSNSLLLKNEGLLPKYYSQQETLPLSDQELEDERLRKEKDIEEMLKLDAQLVKKVVMVSVTYVNEEAIAAELLTYTPSFDLVDNKDISYLLDITFSGDNNLDDRKSQELQSSSKLVTLKPKVLNPKVLPLSKDKKQYDVSIKNENEVKDKKIDDSNKK